MFHTNQWACTANIHNPGPGACPHGCLPEPAGGWLVFSVQFRAGIREIRRPVPATADGISEAAMWIVM